MCESHQPASILESRRNLTRKIKCPSCRAAHIKFTEFHPGPVERFEQNDEYSIQSTGKGIDTTGEYYVMAHCQVCSTQWRVRGLSRVRDLQYAQIAEPAIQTDVHGREGGKKPSRRG